MPANAFTFRIEGARELANLLDQLPKAMSNAVLRNAAIIALAGIRQMAEDNAKNHVGRSDKKHRVHFQDSFVISTKLSSRQKASTLGARGAINVYVGSVSSLAAFIEWGTYKQAPRPVLRPAWDEGKEKMFKIFCDQIGKELIKQAQKLASKAQAGKLSSSQIRALS